MVDVTGLFQPFKIEGGGLVGVDVLGHYEALLTKGMLYEVCVARRVIGFGNHTQD